MKNKRESERLSQMFSGIEVLAVNPAGQSLKIQLESEIPPSQSRSLEMSALKYVNGSFAVEASLFANPQQVEQQSSDGLIWHEHDQIESVDLNDKMETLLELALPLSNISNAIPPPLTSQSQTIGETPIAHLLAGQPRVHESDLADWYDAGIGVIAGLLVTGVILACTSQMDIFNNLVRFILLGWEVLCGILGALAAKSSGNTRRHIWMGAIQWSLVPVWIGVVIIFLIYVIMFTNFFGL